MFQISLNLVSVYIPIISHLTFILSTRGQRSWSQRSKVKFSEARKIHFLLYDSPADGPSLTLLSSLSLVSKYHDLVEWMTIGIFEDIQKLLSVNRIKYLLYKSTYVWKEWLQNISYLFTLIEISKLYMITSKICTRQYLND